MNWTQFLGGITAFYVIYYLLNVAYDLLRGGAARQLPDQALSLSFAADEPARVADPHLVAELEDPETMPPNKANLSSGDLRSTGAVNIRQLFSLAQNDLIRFTGAIPY